MARLRYLQGPVATRNAGALRNTVRGVRAVYETDPEIYRTLLPQPLTALDRPEMFLQMVHVAMHVTDDRTIEIGALTVGVNCTYEGQAGAYCFHMAMEGETVVTSGRERFGEPKKIADTTFVRDGDHVKATCTRHGITYFEIEGTIGESNNNPKNFEEHLFCYKGMPSIETPGKFDGDVFLTRLDWKRNYTERRDMTGEIRLVESAYDPLIDIPVRKLVSMEYVEGGTQTSGTLLKAVPGEFIIDHWVGRNDDANNVGAEIAAKVEAMA